MSFLSQNVNVGINQSAPNLNEGFEVKLFYLAVWKCENLHESPVSQALQVILGALGPLLFLYLLALQLAHAHQAPPDSVTETERERQTTRRH